MAGGCEAATKACMEGMWRHGVGEDMACGADEVQVEECR